MNFKPVVSRLRYYVTIEIISLTLSAIGTLVISGNNTFQVMRGINTVVAIGAVACFEVGLIGLVFRIETRNSDNKILQVIQYISHHGAPVAILVFLIFLGFFAGAERIHVILSDLAYRAIQMVILGGAVPLLSFFVLHAARDAYRRAEQRYEASKQTASKINKTPISPSPSANHRKKAVAKKKPSKGWSKARRQSDIEKRLRAGEVFVNAQLADLYGCTAMTVGRDVKEVEEKIRGENEKATAPDEF